MANDHNIVIYLFYTFIVQRQIFSRMRRPKYGRGLKWVAGTPRRWHLFNFLLFLTCFSYQKTPILIYNMTIYLFYSPKLKIFGTLKAKKWAWPKMGGVMKYKIDTKLEVVQKGPK